MGNSRSRNSARRQSSIGSTSSEQTANRLSELILLRRELERRSQSSATSTRPEPQRPADREDDDENPPFTRNLLHQLIRHHILMESLERHLDLDEAIAARLHAVHDEFEDEDENNNVSDDSDDTFHTASTYEGVQQLFEGYEAQILDEDDDSEDTIKEKARQIEKFRLTVAETFEEGKISLEKKINKAMDVQVTIQDLLRNQRDAESSDQKSFINKLITDMQKSDEYIDNFQLGDMKRYLEDVASNIKILKELTSVKEEDEVRCTVCLSCPSGIIWDCVKCDNLVCEVCKRRITSCPTCRVRFRIKAPRRNRWAEKLARLQREKTILSTET